MARYFRLPFATSGDKETIPDPPDTTNGTVSYTEGYGDNYSLNPATEPGALNVERDMFNQLAFDVTSTLQLYYQTGTPPFITRTDNGGTDFSYGRGARVLDNNRIFESLSSGNTASTSDSTMWHPVDLTGLDTRFTRRSNNLSDLVNSETARTNLGLGSAAVVNTGTGNTNIRINSQNDGRFLQIDNDLSELSASQEMARVNLGLSTMATRTAGETSDTHFRNNLQNNSAYYPRAAADTTFLQVTNNLSDLSNAATARTNLELGTAATLNVGSSSGNIPRNSDLGTASLVDTGTSDANVPTISQADSRYFTRTTADSRFLQVDNNLSELSASQEMARVNLGLSTMATRTAGETSDTHFRNNLQNNSAYYPRAAADTTFLQVTNNLSDLSNAATARTNLELGTAATLNVGSSSGNIPRNSDLGTASLVDTGTSAANVPTISQADSRYFTRTTADSRFLQVDNNLSDIKDEQEARANIGLGSMATRTAGETSDTHFRNNLQNNSAYYPREAADTTFLQVTNNLSDLSNAATARTNLELGTAATLNVGSSSGNIPRNSDLGTASLVDTGTSAANVPTIAQADSRYFTRTTADSRFLRIDNDLSELSASPAMARTNLGLRSAAIREVGTDQNRISLISSSGIGGHTIVDQNDGDQEFDNPNQVNRNGLFYFASGLGSGDGAFPSDGPWFVFSMVHGSSTAQPNDGIKSQIAIKAGEAASEEIFVRGQDESKSTWSDWVSLIAQLAVLINYGFGEFFTNFHNGNFFPGTY